MIIAIIEFQPVIIIAIGFGRFYFKEPVLIRKKVFAFSIYIFLGCIIVIAVPNLHICAG